MTDAEEIALNIYPIDWVHTDNFKFDRNIGRRKCAEDVAKLILNVLKDEKTAREIMFAFFRREHFKEPAKDEINLMTAYMGTALLAYELRLKAIDPTDI